MKTLQEQAKEFRIKKLNEQGYRYDSYQVMADFARQCVHKALEEAAELQEELRDIHYNYPSEDEIVYEGILSLKEKY